MSDAAARPFEALEAAAPHALSASAVCVSQDALALM